MACSPVVVQCGPWFSASVWMENGGVWGLRGMVPEVTEGRSHTQRRPLELSTVSQIQDHSSIKALVCLTSVKEM